MIMVFRTTGKMDADKLLEASSKRGEKSAEELGYTSVPVCNFDADKMHGIALGSIFSLTIQRFVRGEKI